MGQKGCYVYCTDPETNEYFKKMSLLIEVRTLDEPMAELLPDAVGPLRQDGMPLRVLGRNEARPYQNCVPVLDLKAAAGGFHAQAIETLEWVELPEEFRPREGLFVAQVLGESMNRRIPDGSWCLFSTDRGGSREGKIVLVEHRLRDDPETGGRYTVKRYRSEKGT